MFNCVLGELDVMLLPESYQYSNLLDGADCFGRQLRRQSAYRNQWRNQFWQSLDKVSESDARSVPVRTTRHFSDSGNAHVCTSLQTRAETPTPGLLSNDTLESISTTPLTYSSAPSTRKTKTQL